MPYKPIKLTDNVRKQINEIITDLTALREDVSKADNARIDGMTSMLTRCEDCLDKCAKIKETYFPRSK